MVEKRFNGSSTQKLRHFLSDTSPPVLLSNGDTLSCGQAISIEYENVASVPRKPVASVTQTQKKEIKVLNYTLLHPANAKHRTDL